MSPSLNLNCGKLIVSKAFKKKSVWEKNKNKNLSHLPEFYVNKLVRQGGILDIPATALI